MKTITVGELIDAVEKNGYPKITGTLFRQKPRGKQLWFIGKTAYTDRSIITEDSTIGAACAIGQACINLGITQPRGHDVINWIIRKNDRTAMSVSEIGKAARIKFANRLEERIPVSEFDYSPFLKEPINA